MLSGPPDTATAMKGIASKPPIRSSPAANSSAVNGATDTKGSAAETLLLGIRAFPDRRPRVGEIVVKLRQRDASVLLLVGAGARHAQLQQLRGGLGAFRITLVAFGKGRGRLDIPAARVIGLAEEVLRGTGHRILRMLLDKGLERLFGGGIVGLLQQAERAVVLLGRRSEEHTSELQSPYVI